MPRIFFEFFIMSEFTDLRNNGLHVMDYIKGDCLQISHNINSQVTNLLTEFFNCDFTHKTFNRCLIKAVLFQGNFLR